MLAIGMRGSALAAPIDVDVLLKGGTIVDGTGDEPYVGDVAVVGDRIVGVGKFEVGRVGRTIDCRGLVVCPGFIDLHNHSDPDVDDDEDKSILEPENRDGRCYLTQGCTTLVTGNCGGGAGKIGAFYDELEKNGVGINIAHLIPQGEIRKQVMGEVRRAATSEELKKMRELVAAGMEQGAWGISTGLQYVPSAYADTNEIATLASVVAQHGGIYASHIRDEGDTLIESIEEVIEIGRRAKLPVHVSHLKASKKNNWGKVRAAAHVIEDAQKAGIRITADQYPYNASSTSIMAMLLPDKEREGGEKATAARMKNPAEQARLRPVVAAAIAGRGEIMIAKCKSKPEWVGKTITEVAAAEHREPVDIGLEILQEDDVSGVNFGMDEMDVRFVMTLPWVATASDGKAKVDDGTRPHPRSFGTFPRKIGRYSIQEHVLPMPAAVRSASGLPADILGLTDRGYVREKLIADLCVFDPKQFEDRATFERPFETSNGVRWLLVNGQIAIAGGEVQRVLAGRTLRHGVQVSDSTALRCYAGACSPRKLRSSCELSQSRSPCSPCCLRPVRSLRNCRRPLGGSSR
jgi:N-acyl-D-aspartate/D-glutamate deacylase